jgi:Putative Ig domain
MNSQKFLSALCLCASLLAVTSCSGSWRSKPPQPLTITSAVLPQAVLREPYAGSNGFQVTAMGGELPYHWSWKPADGSTLPPGMKLFSNPDSTGTISGAPTITGPYGVRVTVTDSESPAKQASATYIITIAASSPLSHGVKSRRDQRFSTTVSKM